LVVVAMMIVVTLQSVMKIIKAAVGELGIDEAFENNVADIHHSHDSH
jgi:hypothetical protein